ncbi:hypothetical protein [Candidatus Contendibacter odensensis]|uniref:Uncharacterized protein n=1 Tax=Candidatus Contendobacter odensis Run_B_J11 TaxID=1400861 RepID=A0A7U7GAK2_9GAMM|nr:hypothetical protein [Candidatus Contendobacter odensis]CDH44892.1 hypothetical protein BN874_20012 [Candidatus Contendobacter odensis Run_B_J11]
MTQNSKVKNIKRIARKVPVRVIQKDMVSFSSWLPFSSWDYSRLLGSCFFTDKVLWGEIWLKDLSKRQTVWRGYVLDGELYLDETTRRGLNAVTVPNTGKVPSLLPAGKYKVWLDAFVRRDEFPNIYGDDVLTNDDHHDQWIAAPVPHSSYWPMIEVAVPPQGEKARMVVPSSRFHFLYRVSRLVDTLDELIHTHEFQVARVSNVSEIASHISAFMDVIFQAGRNMRINVQSMDDYRYMQGTLRNIVIESLNLINYGYPNDSIVLFRKHVNNIAELLWQLVQDDRYQDHIHKADAVMAEEHRIMLARLGLVFNKIPKTCDFVREDPNALYGESFNYGQNYAQGFVMPYLNMVAGKTHFTTEKPRGAIKWMDSTRKYVITMVNYLSIEWVTKRIPLEKIEGLYQKIGEYAGQRSSLIMPEKALLQKIDQRSRELEDLAKSYAREGCKESERLASRFAGGKMRERKIVEDMIRSNNEVNKINQEIKKLGAEINKLKEETPAKITDRLKEGDGKSAYKAVYWIQGLEIFLKGAVAIAAWDAFAEAWEKNGEGKKSTSYKFADAFFKTSTLMSSVFQFSGLAALGHVTPWYTKIVTKQGEDAAKKLLADKIGKWGKVGKGLGALADVGSAGLTTYEYFYDKTYGKDLLERYTPDDACGMHKWHLVIWGGKWFTGIGSTLGSFSANPISVKLQGIGYLIQGFGEFGEAVYKIGLSEKAHCIKLLEEMRTWNNISKAGLQNAGFEITDLLTEPEYEKMKATMERFEWRDIDPVALENLLGVSVQRS